ncbi:methyltransferase [Cohnella sp. CFH 77786]|uniref:class I SAM-dependent methyltransferase n=1 Tax=Cohnella sp. CFH 77786 TaxID=2662265 RepID=UPI001C60B8E7|nr:SAM-dependent methyltransferase [Cohnella sp. CFH 77786]MBW5447910.1 methyltransferase [Cohnella sp. CFH 77786]
MKDGHQDHGWHIFLKEAVAGRLLLQGTFSQPRRKDAETARKVSIRPLKLKNGFYYQFERFAGNQAFHENVPENEAADKLIETMAQYRQALIKTPESDVQLLANKKGAVAMLRGKPTGKPELREASHNRVKTYVIPEGEPVPFLVRLGVMTPDGKVVKAKYDKFRQINRFLEMASDVLPDLPRGRPLTVVDFGCGKSYLTFALYHLFAVKEGLPVRIVGLDLKADVIRECSRLAEDLGWERLSFSVGDIADYEGASAVDMVVTLHACDTATDAALLKAIAWNASVILSVPCCQHELFRQISQPVLKPMLKHGILKERFAALVTDAIRANLLETAGYRTQILEFIDLEHTPKNLLIRAVRGKQGSSEEVRKEYEAFRDFLAVSSFMEREWREWPKS